MSTFTPYDLQSVTWDLELGYLASSAGTVAPGYPLRVETRWSICGGVGYDEETAATLDRTCIDDAHAVAYQCQGISCRIFASDGAPCDRKIELPKPGAWYACTPSVTVIPDGEGAFYVEATPLSTEYEDLEEMEDIFQTIPLIVDSPDALSIEQCFETPWAPCRFWTASGDAAVLFHVRASVAGAPVALFPSWRSEIAMPPAAVLDFTATISSGGRVDCYPGGTSDGDVALACLAVYDVDTTTWQLTAEARYGALAASRVIPFETTPEPTEFFCATHSCEYPQ